MASMLHPQSRPVSPLANPSYPDRIHTRSRDSLEAIRKRCEALIDECRRKLAVSRPGTDQHVVHVQKYHQLLGSRDQVIEMVGRLPHEVGHLYEEDRHRLDEAVAAIERISTNF